MKSGTLYLRGPTKEPLSWEKILAHEAAHFAHYQRDPTLSVLWNRQFPKNRQYEVAESGDVAVRNWEDSRNIVDFALLTPYSAYDPTVDAPLKIIVPEHKGTVYNYGSLNVEICGVSSRFSEVVANKVKAAVRQLPAALSEVENIVVYPELKNQSGFFYRDEEVSWHYHKTKEEIADAVARFHHAAINPGENSDVFEKLSRDKRYVDKLELLIEEGLLEKYHWNSLMAKVAA